MDSISKGSENNNEYELIFKLIVVGESSVGKTNIISRYTSDTVNKGSLFTIGVELCQKSLKIKDKYAKIELWDTAGQERFFSITSQYFRGSDGCFIVYDITNQNSFEKIDKWVGALKRECAEKISIVLIGNKCDLEEKRVITKNMGMEKAKTLQCPFFETSALSNCNIDEAVKTMIDIIYAKNENKIKNTNRYSYRDDNQSEMLSEKKGKKRRRKKCCK